MDVGSQQLVYGKREHLKTNPMELKTSLDLLSISAAMIMKYSENQQVLSRMSPMLITVLCHSWLDASVRREGMGVKLLIKVWKFSSQLRRKQEAINLFQFHLKPPITNMWGSVTRLN